MALHAGEVASSETVKNGGGQAARAAAAVAGGPPHIQSNEKKKTTRRVAWLGRQQPLQLPHRPSHQPNPPPATRALTPGARLRAPRASTGTSGT